MKYRKLGFPVFLSTILFWCACGGASGSSLAGATGVKTSAAPVSSPATPAAPAAPAPAPSPAPAPAAATPAASAASSRLFPNAAWLYTAPRGKGFGIANYNAQVTIDTHDGGFDYPIQYSNHSHGTMTFTDGYNRFAVPIPNAGGFYPSTGAWGANDGHLVVLDLQMRRYYDFWKLLTDGHGHPRSTRVGKIVSGSLDGDGTPGTTAGDLNGAAGDLMPGELQNGIHHALQCIIPGNWNNASLGTQAPVTKTDGRSNGAMSEGSKIGIDPSLNVSALPLGAGTKNLMRALQQYGCVITDQSGGHGIAIYSNLPSLKGLDMSGMNQIGKYLRFYF